MKLFALPSLLRRSDVPSLHTPIAQAALAQPLTAADGRLPVSEHVRRHCAIYEDGTYYVTTAGLRDAQVRSVVARAQTVLRLALREPQIVDITRIAACYGETSTETVDTVTRSRLLAILETAIAQRAADVNIRTLGSLGQVQYEANGYLSRPTDLMSAEDARALMIAAHYFADDKEEVYRPRWRQDASITSAAKLPDGLQGIRLTYTPTADGTELHLRLIYTSTAIDAGSIDTFGFLPPHVEALYYLMSLGSGLVTFSGPTGAGKTTLKMLWMIALSQAHGDTMKMFSAEDPPEGSHPAIIQFNPAEIEDGLQYYVEAAKTALRNSPHVVSIGECRDFAPAKACFELALTGKMCLTTVHTDQAFDIPKRYVTLGITADDAFHPSRHAGWTAQRLIPTLCPGCRRPLAEATGPEARAIVGAFYRALGDRADQLYHRGPGCSRCQPPGTITTLPGVFGRTLAGEVIIPTPKLLRLLHDGDQLAARRHLVLDLGIPTMRLHAWSLLQSGKIGVGEFTKFVCSPAALAEELTLSEGHNV